MAINKFPYVHLHIVLMKLKVLNNKIIITMSILLLIILIPNTYFKVTFFLVTEIQSLVYHSLSRLIETDMFSSS